MWSGVNMNHQEVFPCSRWFQFGSREQEPTTEAGASATASVPPLTRHLNVVATPESRSRDVFKCIRSQYPQGAQDGLHHSRVQCLCTASLASARWGLGEMGSDSQPNTYRRYFSNFSGSSFQPLEQEFLFVSGKTSAGAIVVAATEVARTKTDDFI